MTEEEKPAEEQQRSLVKVKWDDRALSLAQDQCMRDVLRRNRAATRLAVMAFVVVLLLLVVAAARQPKRQAARP